MLLRKIIFGDFNYDFVAKRGADGDGNKLTYLFNFLNFTMHLIGQPTNFTNCPERKELIKIY